MEQSPTTFTFTPEEVSTAANQLDPAAKIQLELALLRNRCVEQQQEIEHLVGKLTELSADLVDAKQEEPADG